MSRSVLDRNEFYSLCEWIKALGLKNKPIISTYKRLAEQAGHELKFAISTGAVKDAIELTKVSFVPSERRAANLNSDRVQRLAEVVLRTINNLESKLGEKLADDDIRTEIKMLMQRKGRVNVENGKPE